MEPKVRIDLLEVHFDVAGDGEQEFAALFERYVNRWSRLQNERVQRDGELERERMVGERDRGGW
jgi:hypothetical protein